MSAMNFNTNNDTFRKLMGNGLMYRIPRFQRDYSWGTEEWEELWLDIEGTLRTGGEPAHYMGYLVLQSKDEKVYDVIDGQQRLTTLSLIVLGVLKNLQRLVDEKKDPENNAKRLEQIRQTYIGYLDPVTLVPLSKLTLNRNNDQYYQNYIVPLGHLPQRNLKASEHTLRKGFEWFERRIREYCKNAAHEGAALAGFVEGISDKLFFTVISVTDELNAYKVFETLNARGVRLSATDLLKNYLFSVLHRANQHEHEMKVLEDRWEAMVGRLGSESFPDFLRVHWNSRHSFVRQTELFKTIRSELKHREDVFRLLREMEEDVDTYIGLTSPETYDGGQALRNYAAKIKMFNIRQPYPLLLAASRKLQGAGFESVLRACVVISFRYNVIGNQLTSEQERIYNQVAERLSTDKLTTVAEVIGAMASIYPSDEEFKAAFGTKVIRTTQARNRRVVKYLLCEIEKHCSGSDYDAESDSFNIEHVLPQNPEQNWKNFEDEEIDAFCYRLGNMTLLESARNRDIANADYPEKRIIFAQSKFNLTRKIAEENEEWAPKRIDGRQNWMAKQAVSLWRIDQLS